jgi:hypothetical protein
MKHGNPLPLLVTLAVLTALLAAGAVWAIVDALFF